MIKTKELVVQAGADTVVEAPVRVAIPIDWEERANLALDTVEDVLIGWLVVQLFCSCESTEYLARSCLKAVTSDAADISITV